MKADLKRLSFPESKCEFAASSQLYPEPPRVKCLVMSRVIKSHWCPKNWQFYELIVNCHIFPCIRDPFLPNFRFKTVVLLYTGVPKNFITSMYCSVTFLLKFEGGLMEYCSLFTVKEWAVILFCNEQKFWTEKPFNWRIKKKCWLTLATASKQWPPETRSTMNGKSILWTILGVRAWASMWWIGIRGFQNFLLRYFANWVPTLKIKF